MIGQKNKEKGIEDSPLLSKSLRNRSETAKKPGVHSTIHPERFDMSRFSSDRFSDQPEGGSSTKIVLYVIVVIIIGVGLTLLVRFLSTNNTGEETPTDQTQETGPINIDTTPRPDSQATNRALDNEEYEDAEQKSLGTESISAEETEVTGLNYTRYTTFARLELLMSGVSFGLPQMSTNFSNNTLTINLPAGMGVLEQLNTPLTVADIVQTIQYNSESNSIVVSLSEDSKYRIVANNSGIFVDFKTLEQIELDEEQGQEPVETPETPVEPEPETPSTPTGNNTNNPFGRAAQTITNSAVTGNTINYNETFFEDAGSFFELAWGSRNQTGNQVIPNAAAELVTEGGKTYIDVTIQNLSAFGTLQSLDASGIPFSLAGANFVRYDVQSFTNGTVKIRVELKRAADFRLASEVTVTGQTQVTVLQIRD